MTPAGKKGWLITFEGTEGSGKSTQIQLLAAELAAAGRSVRILREPGGTPIGEEIRHTLKHSDRNHAMTPETELLLMCASRAQLVREVIRPALAAGEIVLCDRFADSTIVYQGHGRGLDLDAVQQVLALATGPTQPDLTLLLLVPLAISEARRSTRNSSQPAVRDRLEEGDRAFFERVEAGYQALASEASGRIFAIDATRPVAAVQDAIRARVQALLGGPTDTTARR